MLHGLGRDYLLVDLAFPGATDPFLDAGATYRLLYPMSASIVGVFDTVPGRNFRALVFLEDSEPFDPL